MTRLLISLRVLLATLLVTAAVAGAASAAGHGWTPPPDTIVKVEGDGRNGFGIHYYDGTSIYPPTRSEATAECEEYDDPLDVLRCKTATRQWYRDLADLRQALRYARLRAAKEGQRY